MSQQRTSRLLKIALLAGAGAAGAGLMLAGVIHSRAELMAAGLFAWVAVVVILAWNIRQLGMLVLANQIEGREAVGRDLVAMRRSMERNLALIRADEAKALKRIAALEHRHEDLQRLVLRSFRSLEAGADMAGARASEQRRRLERTLKTGLDALQAAARDIDARQSEQLAKQRDQVAGQQEVLARQLEELALQRKDVRKVLSRSQASLDALAALDGRLADASEAQLRRDDVQGLIASSIRSAAGSDAALGIARQIFDHVKPDVVVDIAAMQALRERAPVRVTPVMTRFSMEPAAILVLVEEVRRSRPAVVLELGSGASTIWLAAALSALGHGRLVSIEHDPAYHAATLELLQANGLESRVDLRLAPIRPCTLDDGRDWPWYDTDAFAGIERVDLLLVDGPPQSVGPMSRFPAFEHLRGSLAPGARIFVDDATRGDEQRMVKQWCEAEPRMSAPKKVVGRLVALQFDATA